MYHDSVKQWNVFVGCKWDCLYCEKSFKRQMKRQKQNCIECYNYEPHFHPKRLDQDLPDTEGDQFIWACSSGDITFAKKEWINQVLEKIREHPDKVFLFQTKDPACLSKYDFPNNVLLSITLETNRDEGYREISKAPLPSKRYQDFLKLKFHNKIVTIEPIQPFDMEKFADWIKKLSPKRVYIGYDSKNCNLPEPSLEKTEELVSILTKFTNVKKKLMKT